MHDLDMEGVIALAIGCVLAILVRHERRLGGNQQQRLDALNQQRQQYYT